MTKNIVARKQHCGLHAAVTMVSALALISVPSFARARKLDDTKSAVRDGSSRHHSHDKSNRGDSDDDDGDDSSAGVLACFIPFILPFCLIAAAVDDDNDHEEDDKKAYFYPIPMPETIWAAW